MSPPIQRDVSLAPFNTFGIDARARAFVSVRSVEDLQALRAGAAWNDGPRLILGGGSNVLFTGDFDGLVVHICLLGHRHLGDDGDAHLVAVDGGTSWDGFVRSSLSAGWPGLENLALIPGTVGASPVQNIGAYGIELAERFAWLETFDVATGALGRMGVDDCAFGYRDSVFKHGLRERVVITRVVFRLPLRWEPRVDYGDVSRMLATAGIARPTPTDVADAVTSIRRAKLPDPEVVGNAGSFFKNPVVDAARFQSLRSREPELVGHVQPDGRYKLAGAWLIDRCGWKGRTLKGGNGRAAVHDRQALVLINRGGASGADVTALARAVQETVQERFDVLLEPEPTIL